MSISVDYNLGFYYLSNPTARLGKASLDKISEWARKLYHSLLEAAPSSQPSRVYASLRQNFLLQNLESQFIAQVFINVDVTANCGFLDYLVPNEGTPKNIQPHLDLANPGLIVSTGTERSYGNARWGMGGLKRVNSRNGGSSILA